VVRRGGRRPKCDVVGPGLALAKSRSDGLRGKPGRWAGTWIRKRADELVASSVHQLVRRESGLGRGKSSFERSAFAVEGEPGPAIGNSDPVACRRGQGSGTARVAKRPFWGIDHHFGPLRQGGKAGL